MAAPAIGNMTNGDTGAAAGSLTISHTVAAGSDRILIASATWSSSNTMATVTYGGVAMTAIGTQVDTSSSHHVNLWYLLAPAVGTANIVFTLTSGVASIFGGGANFTGANQGAPTTATANSSGSGVRSLNITTTVADTMLVDVFAQANATSTITPDAAQTQIYNINNATVFRRSGASYKAVAGTGTNSMSWTISGGTSRDYGFIIAAIPPPFTPPAANSAFFGII